jgi:hypothetical protein
MVMELQHPDKIALKYHEPKYQEILAKVRKRLGVSRWGFCDIIQEMLPYINSFYNGNGLGLCAELPDLVRPMPGSRTVPTVADPLTVTIGTTHIVNNSVVIQPVIWAMLQVHTLTSHQFDNPVSQSDMWMTYRHWDAANAKRTGAMRNYEPLVELIYLLHLARGFILLRAKHSVHGDRDALSLAFYKEDMVIEYVIEENLRKELETQEWNRGKPLS